jgi:hypothetical protein
MSKEFRLSERQERELKEWQNKIKELYGEYGHYDYTFTPYGMGTGLVVTSHLTKLELDLSHTEDW